MNTLTKKSVILTALLCLEFLFLVSAAPTTTLTEIEMKEENQPANIEPQQDDHVHENLPVQGVQQQIPTTLADHDESKDTGDFREVIDPVLNDKTEEGGDGTTKTKRQFYDHSHCYHDHCHDYYSDGHSHVRYNNWGYRRWGWGWGRR